MAETELVSVNITESLVNKPQLPNVEIEYSNLNYSVQLTKKQANRNVEWVFDAVVHQLSTPFRLLGMASQYFKGEKIGEETTEFKILDNIDGKIKPGSMTLILSPPGHGKSIFLKALAQRLPKDASGDFKYSGLTPAECLAKGIYLGHMVQYVDQLDQHIPYMSVRETLDFVHKNANVDPSSCGYPQLHDEHVNRVQNTLDLLHLNNCANTLVGNDTIRGISGGEKKRLTIGEGLLTNARVLLLDEISTGLDASVTYDICNSFKNKATTNNLSVVIAMLQPTPEVYGLFDDIILLREGCVIYHGPRDALPPYLDSIGFKLPNSDESKALNENSSVASSIIDSPNTVDMADYLSELLFLPKKAANRHKSPPLTTPEMLATWKKSDQYKILMQPSKTTTLSLDSPFAQAQFGNQYTHTLYDHINYNLERQFLLLSRNKIFIGFRIFSSIFMAIVFGGMYYQLGVNSGLPRYGLFLNTLLNLAFSNLSEMAAVVENKFIAYKHVFNNTYPSFAYVVATIIAQIPVALSDVFLFCTILYFMSGLTAEVDRYFFYVLCGFCSTTFMGNMFRGFAFVAADIQAAQTLPMPIIALLVVFAGFMITRNHMGWMLFLHYMDIFGWLFRSLAINEFTADRFQIVISGTVTGTTQILGNSYLEGFDIPTDVAWKWYGIIFSVGAIFIAMLFSILAFDYVRIDRNVGSARRLGDAAEEEAKIRIHRRASSEVDLVRSVSMEIKAKSVVPFTPMTVVFKNMHYTVELPEHMGGGQKVLLRNISGYALPGRMIALMGASGAGKTTLLDILASRKNSGKMDGEILLNGYPKEEDSFSRVTSYVEQQDIHLPLLTVQESIEFSAYLRLEPSITVEDRNRFIEEVMVTLELKEIADRKVGEVGSSDGLAPGERKRLTIAVELVSNSPVIFLDEPTSGLDARSAAVVMRVVKRMAQSGRTIICTIHQPSAELFLMFDDLLLLQKGGYMAYFGPIGEGGVNMCEYLQKLPNAKPCPEDMNPASWMLDLLSGSDSHTKQEEFPKLDDGNQSPPANDQTPTADDFIIEVIDKPTDVKLKPMEGEVLAESLFAAEQWKVTINVLEKFSIPAANSKPVHFESKQARNWWDQFVALFSRQMLIYRRDVKLNVGRWNGISGLFLIFGVVYYKINPNDIGGVTSLVAGIFMTAAFCGILNMNAVIPLAVKSRSVYYREQASYMYDSYAYTLANFFVEAPWLFLICMAVLPILYFMVGLSSQPSIFFFHYLCLAILSLVYDQMGIVFSATLPTYEVAQAVSGPIGSLTFLFGGLFAPVPSMPVGSQWVTWIDPVTYAFRAIIPIHFYCDVGPCPTIPVPSIDGVIATNLYTYVKDTYYVDIDFIWPNWAYLWIFAFVLQIWAMYAFKYKRFIVR